MPLAVLKNLSKESGISLDKLETYWKEALNSAKEKSLTGDRKYAYAMGIVKRRSGEASRLERIESRLKT